MRGATPETFAHDPAGNLLGQNNEGTANLANVKGNRLLMQGDRHYDYDAYGNLIRERRGTGQKLVTEYRYDCQHRLIGVSLPGCSTASYKYDAFGRRIEKNVDGHTTEFLWQGERLIAESGDNRYRTYIYEPGSFRPLAMLDGEGPRKATPFYYQLDHLGTPQELTDYSGEIMWSAKYRAYGNLAALDVSEIDNPLRFQGQYFDAETGLHYNRHRYYNPGTGRFLTPDPIKLAGGLNSYQYVPNPTGWVDPLGLNSCPGNKDSQSGDVSDPTKKAVVNDGEPNPPTMTRAERQARIHELTEAMAYKELKAMEDLSPRYHFLEKHGAQTTTQSQMDRAATGKNPTTGVIETYGNGKPITPNSTRYTSHKAQLTAIKRAMRIYKNTGNKALAERPMSMGGTIGEGFKKGGTKYKQQTKAVTILDDNGLPKTSFPKYEK